MTSPNAPSRRRRLGAWIGICVGVIGLVVITTGLSGGTLTLTSVALLYLVPVVIVAGSGGVWVGIAAAIVSSALLNWFFIPPLHTLAVERSDNLVAVVVYVLVAVVVSVAVDLAARQRATAARQAERTAELAAVDRLRTAILAAVGHDLRSPLAAIKAAASSLRSTDVEFSESDRDELLATVEESADQLTDLVENLLAMSRLRAGVISADLRRVALDEVVARALLHAPADSVRVFVDDDLPLVMADPGLLERVIANLVSNALTAAAGGEVMLRGASVGTAVQLAIIDHGTGIPPAERERMFAPFQRLPDRRADGGIGLGLAIARGFTEAMGGTLVPTETPEGGLTMTVTLPAARTPAGSAE